MDCASAGTIRLSVLTKDGKSTIVHAEPGDTTRSLKFQIKTAEGMHPDHQRLAFAGSRLDDCCILSEASRIRPRWSSS